MRVCAEGGPAPDGEVIIADLGLVLDAVRPGEREGEALSKGLLRHRALPEAVVVDMLEIPLSLNKAYLFHHTMESQFNSILPEKHGITEYEREPI